MLYRGLLYVLCWYVGVLPLTKGGILRAISPAGRRFRASALVSGRKNHDVYILLCIHVHIFLLCVFDAWALLLGLYGTYFYKVLGLTVSKMA